MRVVWTLTRLRSLASHLNAGGTQRDYANTHGLSTTAVNSVVKRHKIGVTVNHDWTDESLATLKRLAREGYSTALIGEKMGLSKNAIIGKLNRLGLGTSGVIGKQPAPRPPRPPAPPKIPVLRNDFWTLERTDTLKTMHALGCSAREIATATGAVSRLSVASKIHRLGLSDPTKARQTHSRLPPRKGSVRVGKAPDTGPIPPTPPVLAPTLIGENAAGLLDLKPHHCKWPISGEGADTLFCGDKRIEGRPYCGDHCRRAYVREVRTPAEIVIARDRAARMRSGKGRAAAMELRWAT